MLGRRGGPIPDLVRNSAALREGNMTGPRSRGNNPQMGDDFAAVYEATAHRIPFLDTYRTMCLAPQSEFRQLLEQARDLSIAA